MSSPRINKKEGGAAANAACDMRNVLILFHGFLSSAIFRCRGPGRRGGFKEGGRKDYQLD
jgi:hypothetical protein